MSTAPGSTATSSTTPECRSSSTSEAAVSTITELGLKYNLLTDYTSFIAVDHVVRNRQGSEAVDQPQPMPEGVSNLAVGGEVPSTPEPEFYALIAMAGGLGAWLRRRSKRHAQRIQ